MSDSSATTTLSAIHNLIAAALPKKGNIGFAVGLISPDLPSDTFLAVGSVAYPNQPDPPAPPDQTTVFRLASCTKTFTATLYGHALLIKKAVTADDAVQSYLALKQLSSLELKDLATYASGLPADDGSNPGTSPLGQDYPYTVAAMCTFLNDHATNINALISTQLAKPNPYAYSNLGFALLLAATQNALDYTDPVTMFDTVLFSPLGMTSSGLTPGDGVNYPQAYDEEGTPVTPASHLLPAYYGAGGVYTDATDMFAWLNFNMGTLKATPLSTLLPFLRKQTWPQPARSEAWFMSSKLTSESCYLKNGASAGASSWMAYTADLKYGAFLLANCANLASKVGPGVFSRLTAGASPPAIANELEG